MNIGHEQRYGKPGGNIPYRNMSPEQLEEVRKKQFQKLPPPQLSPYADPEKSIYKYRFLVYTQRHGEKPPPEGQHTEVVVYTNTIEQAITVGVSYFGTENVQAIEAGHIEVDEKGRQRLVMRLELDAKLHVDHGSAVCGEPECKEKAGLPQAWRKKE